MTSSWQNSCLEPKPYSARVASRVQVYDSTLNGFGSRLRSVVCAKLLENALHVVLRGILGYREFVRNFLIAHAAHHQFQYLQLSRAQIRIGRLSRQPGQNG